MILDQNNEVSSTALYELGILPASEYRKIMEQINNQIEEMNLDLNNFKGDEDFLHVFSPQYKPEWFENMEQGEEGLLDIHAGAYETGMQYYMYP